MQAPIFNISTLLQLYELCAGGKPPFIKVVRQTSLCQGTIVQTHTCHSKVLKLFRKKDHRLFDPNFWLLLLGKPTSDEPWMWQDVPPPNIISHFQLKQQPGPVTRFEQFWSSGGPVCVFAWAEFREALLVKLFVLVLVLIPRVLFFVGIVRSFVLLCSVGSQPLVFYQHHQLDLTPSIQATLQLSGSATAKSDPTVTW